MKALTYLEYIHATHYLQVMKNLWDFLLFAEKVSDDVVIIYIFSLKTPYSHETPIF